jgi:hypothetical protein
MEQFISDVPTLVVTVLTFILVFFNLGVAMFLWIDGSYRSTFPMTLVPVV